MGVSEFEMPANPAKTRHQKRVIKVCGAKIGKRASQGFCKVSTLHPQCHRRVGGSANAARQTKFSFRQQDAHTELSNCIFAICEV